MKLLPQRIASAASGATASGSMLIGADGLWSAIRRLLFPDAPLTYSGKMAARTIIPAEHVPEPEARDNTGVWLSRDAHVVHYPIRNHREIAVVAIVDEPDQPAESWGSLTWREVADRARAQAAGLVRPELEPATLTLTLLAIVNGLIQNWMLEPGRFDLCEVGARSLALFLDGIRPQAGVAR